MRFFTSLRFVQNDMAGWWHGPRVPAAVASTSPRASELAQLYVESAYCQYREYYLRLKQIDEEIAEMSCSE